MEVHPTEEMLLDYVRDRLTPEAAAQLRALAEADPGLAAEIAALRAIREAARDPGEIAWSSEMGWARLSREIRQLPSATGRAGSGATGWKVACLVLGALCIGQLALGLGSGGRDLAGGYELAQAGSQRPVLRVIFRQDAREGDIRNLVRAAGGEFVAGPSAQALYDIGFADAAARDEALAEFSQRSDLVEHAEAAGPR